MSDCFCIEAAHSKAWPALLLYHPPSHSLMLGLCWPKGSPQEVGCVLAFGGTAPETLADTELGYLCKDLPLAHPQDGGADSS